MADRLDVALVRRGLAPTRTKAQARIREGLVFINDVQVSKPSASVEANDVVEVRGQALRYVGRGGLKLEKALDVFSIDLHGVVCVDIGASTGGFTDCMLQRGASRVFSVDVGHGQLDTALAQDPRVTNMEGRDIRTVTLEEVCVQGRPPAFAATDVSFIPLAKVLPAMARLVGPGGSVVCLVKPQFEAGPEHVGKRGIVRDPRVHANVIESVLETARSVGLLTRGLSFSPVTGGEGNIEYLLHAMVAPGGMPETGRASIMPADTDLGALISSVVAQAHETLGGHRS